MMMTATNGIGSRLLSHGGPQVAEGHGHWVAGDQRKKKRWWIPDRNRYPGQPLRT